MEASDIRDGALTLAALFLVPWARAKAHDLLTELARKLAAEAWAWVRGHAGELAIADQELAALGHLRRIAWFPISRWSDADLLGSLRWVLAQDQRAAARTIEGAWHDAAPAARAGQERLERAGERAAELERERAPGGG